MYNKAECRESETSELISLVMSNPRVPKAVIISPQIPIGD